MDQKNDSDAFKYCQIFSRLYFSNSFKKKHRELYSYLTSFGKELDSVRDISIDNSLKLLFFTADSINEINEEFKTNAVLFIYDDSCSVLVDHDYQVVYLGENTTKDELKSVILMYIRAQVDEVNHFVDRESVQTLKLLVEKSKALFTTLYDLKSTPAKVIRRFDELNILEDEILSSVSISISRMKIEEFISKIIDASVRIISVDELGEVAFAKDVGILCFSNRLKEKEYYVILKRESLSSISDLEAYMLLRSFLIFDDYLNVIDRFNFTQIDMIWDEVFSKIKIPLAVFSGNGELIIHNNHFAKLGIPPKECLKFRDGDSFTIRESIYRVFKRDSTNKEEAISLLFLTHPSTHMKQMSLSPTSGDLGIITSSVAHELNNPLAGILTSIAVLELEDSLPTEVKSALSEMKKSARRCKDLVETFLGFSKAKTDHSSVIERGELLSKAVDQAFHLIRFRLVETNLKLDFSIQDLKNVTIFAVNLSVFSMVLYLILGELITAFSHHLLISDKKNDDSKVIRGEIFYKDDRFTMEMITRFKFREYLMNTRLIKHLLDIEGIDIHIDENRVVFEKKRRAHAS